MELINVSKKYTKDNEIIRAVDNVNIEFEKGKFYVIMGESGAGKSTLIQILGLLDSQTTGSYIIGNQKVSDLSDKDLAKLRNKNIGFVFQSFHLNNKLKAFENVILPMLINNDIPRDERYNKAVNILSSVGLSNRINHFPSELSGGEQQRVAFSRALANNPDYILADEPTGNLDDNNEVILLKLLKEMSSKGKTVIVVSHSESIKKYADVVCFMKKGKLYNEK